LKAIVGNAAMIKAYSDGIPANGKPVPDGAVMAKIEWSRKSHPASPYTVSVPDMLQRVDFMMKDAKRFFDTDGALAVWCMAPQAFRSERRSSWK
jgi:hypothetical protein